MIDWIDISVPLTGCGLVSSGAVLHVSPDGEIESSFNKTLWVQGSYSQKIGVSNDQANFGYIRVQGSPLKFLQGHNLFGPDDFVLLCVAVLEKLAACLGVIPSQSDFECWRSGDFEVFRVDITRMYELGCFSDVSAWIRAASTSASVRWRGRGHYQDGTLYFGKVAKGKRASQWQLKIYHKGAEVRVPGHALPDDLPYRSELLAWSENKLRIELTIRRQELRRKGVSVASSLSVEAVRQLYEAYLARLELGESVTMDVDVLEGLKPRLRAAVALWETGCDLRAVYSRSQFYKLRRDVFDACQLDIGAAHTSDNVVVKLQRVLTAAEAQLPDFGEETFLRLVA